MRKFLSLSLIAFSLLFNFALLPSADAGTLGLGIEIVPASAKSAAIGTPSNLWFLIQPGGSQSRQLVIHSRANVATIVKANMAYGYYLNGTETWDDTKESPLQTWTTFSDKEFRLNPGESKTITLTINVPKSAPIGTEVAYVFFTMLQETKVKQTARFAIGSGTRVGAPIFLGIGTIDQISVDFKFLKTSVFNRSTGRYLSVTIENTGKTPIAPVGYLKIHNETGDITINRTIPLYSQTIVPGERGLITIRVPDTIPNGKWVVDSLLQQGAVQKTSSAKITLTKLSIFTKRNIFTFALALFFIFLMALGLTKRRKVREDKENSKEDDLMDQTLIGKDLSELKKPTKKPAKSKGSPKKSTNKKPAKPSNKKKPTTAKKKSSSGTSRAKTAKKSSSKTLKKSSSSRSNTGKNQIKKSTSKKANPSSKKSVKATKGRNSKSR